MGRVTVRIRRSTHALLRALAEEQGTTIAEVVDRAVRDYRRHLFWSGYVAAHESLAADPAAAHDYRREVEAWDATLSDGLPDGPHASSK